MTADNTVVQIRDLPAKPKIEETDTGILFPVGIVYAQWASVAKRLQREHKSFMWKLGDSFLAGEERFSELYSQAIEEYSIETIRTAMRVCRAFPYQRRRPIGFYFHQVVYALRPDEQDELLALVEKNGWTREAMREEVRDRRQRAEAAANAAAPQLAVNQTVSGSYNAEAGGKPAEEDIDGETKTRHLDSLIDPDEEEMRDPGLRRDDMRPHSEPAPIGRRGLNSDDAAAFLTSVARAALPENVAGAVIFILSERDRLLQVLAAAEMCIKAGELLPVLEETVAHIRGTTATGRPTTESREATPVHQPAHDMGYEDGLAGHRDHAARYPAGEYGHADYWTGHAEAEADRGLPRSDAAD